MPDTLPSGTLVSMMARDDNIGQFDAITSTRQWHVVTRGYAEPWTLWADDALWEFGLLYLSAGMIMVLARDIKRRRAMAQVLAM